MVSIADRKRWAAESNKIGKVAEVQRVTPVKLELDQN